MSEPELYAKLAKAISRIAPVAKSETANMGSYAYSYTTLSDTLAAVKEAFATEALTLMQPLYTDDGDMHIDTIVIDQETGDHIVFPGLRFPTVKDPQAMGSSATYGRRYGLTSLCGMEVADDDGRAAKEEVEKQNKPHPLSHRVAEVQTELRAMSDDDQADIKEWAGDRSLAAPSMLDNEEWLTTVETWLDERNLDHG